MGVLNEKRCKNCFECKRELQEPWETVYFNIKNKTYFCGCCYNDKRNKVIKNVILVIVNIVVIMGV